MDIKPGMVFQRYMIGEDTPYTFVVLKLFGSTVRGTLVWSSYDAYGIPRHHSDQVTYPISTVEKDWTLLRSRAD